MAAQSPLLRSNCPPIANLLRKYVHQIDIDIKFCSKYATYVQIRTIPAELLANAGSVEHHRAKKGRCLDIDNTPV
jgi:hypothetical protein